MKKLSLSVFALLAIVFAVTSAFTSQNKTSKKLSNYEIFGVDQGTQPSSGERTTHSWFISGGVEQNDVQLLDESGTSPVDLGDITSTYCNQESGSAPTCLVKFVDNSFQDYVPGDFSNP